MGLKIEELGLNTELVNHLKEIEIKRFYKFQEEAIQEIIYGSNVIIEAPTASGKTFVSKEIIEKCMFVCRTM